MKHRQMVWKKLQNAAIVLLSLTALLLLTQTQLFRQDARRFSLSEIFSSAESDSTVHDLSSLTMPLQLLISGDYGRSCYSALTTEDTVYLRYLPFLREAFGSAAEETAVSQEEFQQACLQSGAFFDFLNAYPLTLFSQLYRTEQDALGGSVRHALLTPSGTEDAVWLYLADGSGGYRRFTTSVSAVSLLQAGDGSESYGASFAFESNTLLYPFSIYPEDLSLYPLLTASNPLTDSALERMMGLLGFNVHTNYRYTESSGTQVIVEDSNTLRVSTDGVLLYQGSSPSSDLLRLSTEEPGPVDAVVAAWNLAGQLTDGLCGDARLYLLHCEKTENGYLLSFGYMINGVPLQAAQDTFALQVTVGRGQITELKLHCRSYTRTETRSLLLPVRQAVAAAGEESELFLAYADTGGDTVCASWLSRRNSLSS